MKLCLEIEKRGLGRESLLVFLIVNGIVSIERKEEKYRYLISTYLTGYSKNGCFSLKVHSSCNVDADPGFLKTHTFPTSSF